MPVIIETGYEEWPYAVRGTYFIAKVNQHCYAITARHVVHGNFANKVFFRYKIGSRNSLPLSREITVRGYQDESSPENTDIILYEVDLENINENFNANILDTIDSPG